MTDIEQKQVDMHTNYFDRCERAIQEEFYLEAILMEYAAIESRLEAICGVLGLPCGRDCKNKQDIKISARIECLRKYRNKNKEIFSKTKLPDTFFTPNGELKTWIRERDKRVHGLYKNASDYQRRLKDNKELAEKGYKFTKLLYNEARRIRRMKKANEAAFDNAIAKWSTEQCKANREV